MSHSTPRNPLRSVFRWHRWLGLALSILVVLLALTGVMLNHTEALRLNERRVFAPWLLSLYGIPAPRLTAAYPLGNRWISQWDRSLFLDERPLAITGELRGVVETPDMLVVALADRLALMTKEGQSIENFALPCEAVGQLGNDVYLRTPQGLRRADGEMLQWRPVEQRPVPWSSSGILPDPLRNAIARREVGEGLALERIVFDLHSGRLLGHAGVVIMDFAAVALLLSTGTGLWLWRQQSRARKRKPSLPPP